MENYGGELSSDLTCYKLRSRPDVGYADSDFDLLNDYDDPEPMICQFYTYDLGGGSFKPSQPDEGYIKVDNIYYGGDQSWFDHDNIAPRGCGLIALHDVTSYIDNNRNFTMSEYKESVDEMYDNIEGSLTPVVGLPILPYGNMKKLINDENTRNGVSITYSLYDLVDYKSYGDSVYYKVKIALYFDRPVIYFGMGMILYEFVDGRMETRKGLDLSDYTDFDIFDSETYDLLLRQHYVTITGIIIVDGEVFFRVQSWGKAYYLKYNEMFGIGNSVYIAD